MTGPHRNILTKGMDRICRCLRSINKICNGLVTEEIFTVEETEEVMHETTECKKATKLVHYLLKASDGGFFIFQNLLIQTKQVALAHEVYGGTCTIVSWDHNRILNSEAVVVVSLFSVG